jgi:hypothetical protein
MRSSNTSANDNLGDCRPEASRTAAVYRRDLSLLTVEEKITYRKWRFAVLIAYSAAAVIITAISIAIGPGDTSPHSKNAMYRADSPAAHRSQR